MINAIMILQVTWETFDVLQFSVSFTHWHAWKKNAFVPETALNLNEVRQTEANNNFWEKLKRNMGF